MEKKTNIVQFTTTPGKTVLERFKNYIKRNDTSEGMLEILSIENARAIGLNGVEGDSVFEKYAEEYAEFFDYFTSHHMNEEMEDRFTENWGNYPYVLRFAAACKDYIENERMEDLIRGLNKKQLSEVESLCEKIFAIRKHRLIVVICPESGDRYTLELPATIRKKELDGYRHGLKRLCAIVIKNGIMFVRTYEKNPKNMSDPHDIFAVKSDDSGNWIPVSKKELLFCHTKTPTGMIEPELNANYTEITKID